MIYVGLGSNLGDREAQLEAAVRRIAGLAEVRIMDRSTWWENPAVCGDFQPPFLNGVLGLESSRSAGELIGEFQRIERELGRERKGDQSARTLDLDLLLMGEDILSEDELEIPHPRMHERLFVLIPMMEIAPDAIHPVLGKTVKDLYGALEWGVYG